MDLTLVPILRCPNCAHNSLAAHPFDSLEGDRCSRGVLVCAQCSSWFPISEGILELLPEGASEPGSRAEFFSANSADLARLGIEAPKADAIDPAFREQAHQREHFDQLALRDDEFSYEALERLPFQQALRRISFGGWRPMIGPGSLVLDIGCANGVSSFNIGKPGIKVLGFDISRELIAQATARARTDGLANTTFIVADADSIPVADAAIDCVLCYGSLHHMPDPARTLHEAARVLKPEGLYLGLENNKTPLRPIFDLLMRLRPVWKEEAGAEAQMGATELRRWIAGSELRLDSRPTVFAPPHLFNRLSVSAAERLMRWTDAILGRVPFVRNWAGMITIEGRKEGAETRLPTAERAGAGSGAPG